MPITEKYRVKFVKGESEGCHYTFIAGMMSVMQKILSALEDCGLDFHRNFKIEYMAGCGSHTWSAYIDGEKIVDYVDGEITLGFSAITGGTWDRIINHPNFQKID